MSALVEQEDILYPDPKSVEAGCDGTRSVCVFRNREMLYPQLPCGQRCLTEQKATVEPKDWYRFLIETIRNTASPVYVSGIDELTPSVRDRFLRLGILSSSGFVRHWFDVGKSSMDWVSLLPKNARRDVRIGERAGLEVCWRVDRSAAEVFYGIYASACRERGQAPLPESFVTGERKRSGGSCSFALVTRGEEVVGAWMTVLDSGVLKIIEGAALASHRDAQVSAWMVSRFILRAQAEGASTIDFGVTNPENQGLRTFKSRMGFQETPDVVRFENLERGPRRPEFRLGRVDLALLEQCNFGCGFCYREPWVPELEPDAVRRKIDEVAALKHSGIAFSGGEPTLRKDLEELIRYARQSGIWDIQLHTNGIRFSESGFAERMRDAGLVSAMVSLHATRGEQFAAITRTKPEWLQPTLDGIQALRKAGVYVMISHVINALNFRDWPQFVEYVRIHFPGSEIFLFFVYPSVKGEGHSHLYPRLAEVQPFWLEGLQRAREIGVKVTVDSLAGLPLCCMGDFAEDSRWARVEEHEFYTDGEVDDHHVKAPEMRHGAQCSKCKHVDTCPGFWSDYLDRYGDAELEPVEGQ